MPSKIKSEKIDALEEKIKQLQARKAAELARIKTIEKKADTRRKILVGACILEDAEKNGSMPDLLKKLDQFLTRKNDRELFDLPSPDAK